MIKDAQGQAVSGATTESVALYDQAVRAFNLGYGDAPGQFDAAREASPGFAMAHLAKAWLFVLANDPLMLGHARSLIQTAAGLTLNEREQAHLAALQQAVAGARSAAAAVLDRLSSSEPNLQNIPIRTEDGRKIRRAFVASPGMKLVSADYSQIELRLLSEIANVPTLRKAFQDGVDIHAMTASEMFGVPVKDMPPDVRRRAKAINFGIIYGISAFGLGAQLGIDAKEAGAYIKKYFERFPGIRDYMDETREFCREHGYVLTLFGRKCHYPEIKASNPSIRSFNERAAINARLQGSAADIIRRAMIRVEPELQKDRLGAKMLLQVHDELIFEVPANEVERTLPIIKSVMQSAPDPSVSLHVPLQVDARAANNWDEAH